MSCSHISGRKSIANSRSNDKESQQIHSEDHSSDLGFSCGSVFNSWRVLVKLCSRTITWSVFSSSLQGFMVELLCMLLLFDEISSLSCLWAPRKCPVKAQRQAIWLSLRKSPPSSENYYRKLFLDPEPIGVVVLAGPAPGEALAVPWCQAVQVCACCSSGAGFTYAGGEWLQDLCGLGTGMAWDTLWQSG